MKSNTKNNNPFTLKGEPLEETDSFTYLGSTMNKNGGTEEDVKATIQKARVAFIMLRQIWKAKQIKINTKRRIFNSNVKALLLEDMAKYTEDTKKNTDVHQQMLAQNPTPEVDRQGTQHFTLEVDQTTTHRKCKKRRENGGG